ncbi:uncharacterized protein LOC117920890 isoform X2 [Vitis riparia]|uniref:uncharacterized protein LOC117920890 isoform X2 n=1 Tax=Vitis riparia TaxID=96939 RepID=UPI00155AC174|nr:uncharacterized protein LOC117920890 isoform X2 [Vitis riparia]
MQGGHFFGRKYQRERSSQIFHPYSLQPIKESLCRRFGFCPILGFLLIFLSVGSSSAAFQPLTEIAVKKCKRCGFYEQDSIKSDDVFDEWEFCLSDFIASDGKYVHFKNKEFNATFLCPECIPLQKASDHTTGSHNGGKGVHLVLVIMVSALVSIVSVLAVVAVYKYWQKRKREQDQARFLKLFEDGDDIEDELAL